MSIGGWYKEQFSKPCEFHRISELLNSTLLNFTLFLAIFSLALQAAFWLTGAANLSEVFVVLIGIPPIRPAYDVLMLMLVSGSLFMASVAFLALVFLFPESVKVCR